VSRAMSGLFETQTGFKCFWFAWRIVLPAVGGSSFNNYLIQWASPALSPQSSRIGASKLYGPAR
jgi:hypothetical protein